MSSQEDIAGQQELLAAHRRTLSTYLRQLASIGIAHAPPALLNGIQDARDNIARIKSVLRGWGVEVVDHPDDESLDVRGMRSPPILGTGVPRHPSTRWSHRWLVGGMLSIVAVSLLAWVITRFLTSNDGTTQAPSFTYNFPNNSADWAVEASYSDKWQVIEASPGNFVYQGIAPSDHDINSSPPSNDKIANWSGYATQIKVRIIQPSTNYYAFGITMRGGENTPSGCIGYRFLFNTSQGEVSIDRDGVSDQCPPKSLIKGRIPVSGDQWFTVRTEAVGAHLRLYIDDKLVLQTDDAALSKGYFSVSVSRGATVQFDDIEIREISEDTKTFQSSKPIL